jgi:hypothetical protein
MTSRSFRFRRSLLLPLTLLLALPPAAAARSLHWRALEVDARLDADGRLHVVERHAMVFDGDWNGGERRFELHIVQDLDLHRVSRVDPVTGTDWQLARGDLDEVDRYDWADGNVLRWRSRRPSDPPFAGEEIVYVLEYTLAGVLRERDGRYLLSHDFAFSDRAGSIERFTLDLELDRVWRELDPLPAHLERLDLPPGQGVPLAADLAYAGERRPAAVLAAAPLALRYAAFAAALALLGWLYLGLRRHEQERGRFEAADVPEGVDPGFLEEHLFSMRPEVAGAVWDHRIGPPEVAAVIARLVAEGRLASSVREKKGLLGTKRVLELKLLVDRGALGSYERKLVDKLFFDGRTETDTEAVRRHYKNSGFDPTGVIREPIEKRLRPLVGRRPPKPSPRVPWICAGVFGLLLGLEFAARGAGGAVLVALLSIMATLPIIAGSVFVSIYRRSTHGLDRIALGFLLPALVLLAVLFLATVAEEWLGFAIPDFYPGPFGVLALAAFAVFVASVWLHLARTRDAPEAVRLRRKLAEIRRRFAKELDRPDPRLDDAWLPYLLAFGLDRRVDRWFTSFGGRLADHGSVGTAGWSSSSGSSQWTGGGGAFGGAGASASWAAAAAGLAAGVASPSSSGGSSGGGGSFSGGGGGGGW